MFSSIYYVLCVYNTHQQYVNIYEIIKYENRE